MNAAKFETLRAQQQALVSALFALPGDTRSAHTLRPYLADHSAQSQRDLQAYEANGHALAERCLSAAFPVIAQMLGSPSFNALARDLWHRQPPERGDLAHWGEALPVFLAHNTQLTDVPYLADVARAEWALHRVAFAADAQPDPGSFARLTSEDPETLTLTLSPGTSTLSSPFPVASLVLAHLQAEPSLPEASARLRAGTAETALIWRQGMIPRLAHCSAVATDLIGLLQTGRDLAGALDKALASPNAEGSDFDFSAWLTDAVTQGLVTGVHDAATTNTSSPSRTYP